MYPSALRTAAGADGQEWPVTAAVAKTTPWIHASLASLLSRRHRPCRIPISFGSRSPVGPRTRSAAGKPIEVR